jgi:uncharacterized protein with HEPN domain
MDEIEKIKRAITQLAAHSGKMKQIPWNEMPELRSICAERWPELADDDLVEIAREDALAGSSADLRRRP